jgi:hypothetical protein
VTDFIPATPAVGLAPANVGTPTQPPLADVVTTFTPATVIVGVPSTSPPPHVIVHKPEAKTTPKQYAWQANRAASKKY